MCIWAYARHSMWEPFITKYWCHTFFSLKNHFKFGIVNILNLKKAVSGFILVIHWIVRVYKNCKMRGSVRTEEMKICHQILFSHRWPAGSVVTVIGIFCLYVWSHISETIHHRPQVSYIFGILGPRATFLRKKVFWFGPPKNKKDPF